MQAYTDPAGNDRGRAPVVIAHGLFGQKTNWNSIGKALHRRLGVQVGACVCVRQRAHSIRVQVYAVDIRNHGASPHTDIMTYESMADDCDRFINDVALVKSGERACVVWAV